MIYDAIARLERIEAAVVQIAPGQERLLAAIQTQSVMLEAVMKAVSPNPSAENPVYDALLRLARAVEALAAVPASVEEIRKVVVRTAAGVA